VQRGSHGPREGARRAEVKRRKPRKPAPVTLQTEEAVEGEEPRDGTVLSRERVGSSVWQAVEGSGWEASDGLLFVKLDGREGGTLPHMRECTP
jgi:hypothetical protein